MTLDERCGRIRLILSDVDGVLTDGSVMLDNRGIEIKRYHIRDGVGIRLWQRAGYRFGLVTGRNSHSVQLRAAELGVEIVRQGVEDKWPSVEKIAKEFGLEADAVCFVGDDLPDLPAIRHVGLGVAVADAAEEVRSAAAYVTSLRGGGGAIRETVELILKNQNRWNDLTRKYIQG